jgi:hypothetical protein
MKKSLIFIAFSLTIYSEDCRIPINLAPNQNFLTPSRVQNNIDLIRNRKSLKNLCIYSIYFKENSIPWSMLLVFNKNKHKKVNNSPFWFLPHDNENSAFDSAIYATLKYGGGFLAVQTGGHRNNHGVDPNRNFSTKSIKGRCKPSPIYTDVVFRVIDYFKSSNMPYLALHTNSNGIRGDKMGGSGTISILRSTKTTKAFPAYKHIKRAEKAGLMDEDSLIYIAGKSPTPPKQKLDLLLQNGLNVKYEYVAPERNDCSMSNYVVLGKNSENYYNIEVENGDTKAQKEMIDRLLKLIKK